MDVPSLKQVIQPYLEPGQKIANIETSISEHQGHGSVMLKLKVIVKDENGKEEDLHLVAKRLPESEHDRKIFDIQVSFKKEVQFYEIIIPVLEEFRKEEGLSGISKHFARFYGARYNLKGTDDIIDDDGVMILENLCVRGFGNGNTRFGFDLKTTESVLTDLANFHGTVIGLKRKRPEIFENRIKPLCIPFIFQEEEVYVACFNGLRELIQSFPEYSSLAEKATNFLGRKVPKPREPFSTITHCDLWVNNIMNKVGDDGKIQNAFVDFQLFGHRSAVADVFFFLWTSVEEEILKDKFDYLLKYYHQSLLDQLKEFSVDTSPYSYEKFEEELQLEAEYEFGHTLIFVTFLKHFRELDEHGSGELQVKASDFTTEVQNFIHFMVAECVKRNWLY